MRTSRGSRRNHDYLPADRRVSVRIPGWGSRHRNDAPLQATHRRLPALRDLRGILSSDDHRRGQNPHRRDHTGRASGPIAPIPRRQSAEALLAPPEAPLAPPAPFRSSARFLSQLLGMARVGVLCVAAGLFLGVSTAWADEEAEAVDSNTPWEVKQELKEESTGKQVALAVPRAIAWPFQQVGNGMEKGLLYVEDNHVLEWLKEFQRGMVEDGIFPIFGGLGDGAGLGGGVLLRRPGGSDPPRSLSLRLTASIRNFHHHELAFFDRSIAGPVGVNLRAAYLYMPQQDFYGLGRESQEEDRTDYRQQTIAGVASFPIRLSEHTQLRPGGII